MNHDRRALGDGLVRGTAAIADRHRARRAQGRRRAGTAANAGHACCAAAWERSIAAAHWRGAAARKWSTTRARRARTRRWSAADSRAARARERAAIRYLIARASAVARRTASNQRRAQAQPEHQREDEPSHLTGVAQGSRLTLFRIALTDVQFWKSPPSAWRFVPLIAPPTKFRLASFTSAPDNFVRRNPHGLPRSLHACASQNKNSQYVFVLLASAHRITKSAVRVRTAR